MNKILKRRRGRRGFTLIELLVTIAVMLLVTEIISLTIQLSTKYYTQSVRNSESQTICGALSAAVQEELQYATKVQPITGDSADGSGFYPDQRFTYYSRARQHGSSCTLVCEEGKLYVRKGGSDYALVGSETYTYNMTAEMNCRWNKNGYFSVSLKVMDGDKEMASQEFDVYPLNNGY